MGIASSATGAWADLILLSVQQVQVRFSRGVLELELRRGWQAIVLSLEDIFSKCERTRMVLAMLVDV